MGGRERRRKLVVNQAAQKRIVFAVSLFPAISLAVATMVIAIFCRKLMGEATRSDVVLPSLVWLLASTLGFSIVSILIIVNQALRFSNRVSGPAYRMCKSFEQVRSGDVSFRVKLRKGDHLTEVADSFNELLVWLEAHPPQGVETKAVAAPTEVGEPVTAGTSPSA